MFIIVAPSLPDISPSLLIPLLTLSLTWVRDTVFGVFGWFRNFCQYVGLLSQGYTIICNSDNLQTLNERSAYVNQTNPTQIRSDIFIYIVRDSTVSVNGCSGVTHNHVSSVCVCVDSLYMNFLFYALWKYD
jgi:hypothetical protein